MKRKRVIVVSIDGLKPSAYLAKDLEAPELKQLAAKGAFATALTPVYPTVTYPNHTTMVTGVTPAKHGIISNTKFSAERFCHEDWYWEAKYIRQPTLWDVARKAGLRVALLRWPVTVGAKADWCIPEVFPIGGSEESNLETTITHSRPRKIVEKLIKLTESKRLSSRSDQDAFVSKAVSLLNKRKAPDLVLCHLINLDHVYHHHAENSKEVRSALARTDDLLAEIKSSIDFNDTVLIVLGDHGYEEYEYELNFNALLEKHGWLKVRDNKISEWTAITQNDGGEAALYCRDAGLASKALELLEKNAGKYYSIIPRTRLDALGALPYAVCGLEPAPGYSAGCGIEGPFITKLTEKHCQHGFLPERPGMKAGLVMRGAEINAGTNLGEISMLEISPLIARLLGLEFPAIKAAA